MVLALREEEHNNLQNRLLAVKLGQVYVEENGTMSFVCTGVMFGSANLDKEGAIGSLNVPSNSANKGSMFKAF